VITGEARVFGDGLVSANARVSDDEE